MAAHYEATYGEAWVVAHNGVRNASLAHDVTVAAKMKKVLLAGDVNVFRFDAVLAFAEAIERHNRRHGKSIEFSVMGEVAEQHRSLLSRLSAVRLLGRRSHSDCLSAMTAADLLYLPLAFCKRSSRISLYSMPTKLPEYLASGKTVFFHAPKESAMFRVAERHDLEPRVATIDPEELDSFIDAWANEDQNSNERFVKARNALREEFDLDQLSARFQSAFS
jgi:hypothetical protein